MKKIYYLLLSLVAMLITIMACENSSIEEDELQMSQKEDVLLQKGEPASKVTICHYDNYLDEYYQITISEKGLNGHNDFGNTPRHEMDNFNPVDLDQDGIMDCADCAINNPDTLASMKKIWYYDYDGDGYGADEFNFIKICNPRPEMYYTAEVVGDCNDMLNTVYLGAIELQDGIDNDCDGIIDNNIIGDCGDGRLIYSPEGTYVFRFMNIYNHDYIIDSFDGINFSGTGGYPAGGTYSTWEKIEGTVIDGHLVGLITFLPGSADGEYTWPFEGAVSECDGIISLVPDWQLVE